MKPKHWMILLAAAALLAGTAAAQRTGVRTAYVLICADAAEGTLFTADGTERQALTFDERGQAVAGPLPPGDYTVQAGDWTAAFTLRTNASVGEVSGDGWSDGEILHLSRRTLGQLVIRYTGDWRWTLEGEKAGEAVPLLHEDGERTQCVFSQLPLGAYVLHGDDGDWPVLLTEDAPNQTLDLCPQPEGITGPLG